MTTGHLLEFSAEDFGELLSSMDSDLASLVLLSCFGNARHRAAIIAAVYDIDFLRAKQRIIASLDESSETRKTIISLLKLEGYLL